MFSQDRRSGSAHFSVGMFEEKATKFVAEVSLPPKLTSSEKAEFKFKFVCAESFGQEVSRVLYRNEECTWEQLEKLFSFLKETKKYNISHTHSQCHNNIASFEQLKKGIMTDAKETATAIRIMRI